MTCSLCGEYYSKELELNPDGVCKECIGGLEFILTKEVGRATVKRVLMAHGIWSIFGDAHLIREVRDAGSRK